MAKQLTDAQFVERLTSDQMRLRAFAITLMPFGTDADDVLQDACMTLWEKRSKYDADREFYPWACGVVLIQVLRYRRKKATDKLLFDEVLINTIATEYVANTDKYDLHREQLRACVDKLGDKDRGLLEDRYRSNMKPKEMALQRGRPLTTVYSALARIRELLHRCIEASLVQQSHP